MSEEHAKLRQEMLAEKGFLLSLYSNDRRVVRSLLQAATDKQVTVLLSVLKCVASGEIPMKKNHLTQLVGSKREPKLRSLRNSTTYQKLLNGSQKEKVQFLSQFCANLQRLLHPLFNKI